MADIVSLDQYRKARGATSAKGVRVSRNKTRRARISRSVIMKRRAVFLDEVLFGNGVDKTV